MLVDGTADRISSLAQGSGLVASQLVISCNASNDVHHCVCVSVHSSNSSRETSQEKMLNLHVDLVVGECDRNKCMRLL